MNIDLRLGDCIEVLKTIPDNSIDSIVTDPPYGLEFMGKEWDTFKEGRISKYKQGGEINLEQIQNMKGKGGAGPSYTKRAAAKCRNCGKQRWSGSPCKCEEPDFEIDNSTQHTFQSFTEAWARECYRVLKPGGHLLAFGGSRMYHRLACGVEDAGFEIRDQIMWVYGSGFPKSHNIGKAIDKRKEWDKYEIFSNSLKSKREKMGLSKKQAFDKCGFQAETFGGNSWYEDGRIPSSKDYELLKSGLELGDEFDGLFEEVEREFIANDGSWGKEGITKITGYGEWKITKGNSDWEGWGTALKPAHEPIVLARKPLSEKSIAENVLKHGTGGLNIDGSRIEMKDKENINFDRPRVRKDQKEYFGNHLPDGYFKNEDFKEYNESGRWPANIIFDEEAGKLLDEQSGTSKTKPNKNYKHSKTETESNTFTGRGTYTPREDEGGASRFFYCPKTSKKDRNEGLDGFEEKIKAGAEFRPNHMEKALEGESGNPYGRWNKIQNNHPTVKPTDLMRYLINLVTPKGGTTLDPFMGSGSTGKAAVRCGVNFIGIEKEEEYMKIAEARINHERNKPVQQKLL